MLGVGERVIEITKSSFTSLSNRISISGYDQDPNQSQYSDPE
jgi:hypothetical protein